MEDIAHRDMRPGPADIPAMPVIPRSEPGAHPGRPHVLAPPSGKHFIGWQARGDREDSATFVVLRATVFDDLKVMERFPLTRDGWRQAWQALARADSGAAEKARAMFAEQAVQAQARADIAGLEAATIGYVPGLIFLGGYAPGPALTVRGTYDLRFLTDRIAIVPGQGAQVLVQVPYRDIEDVDIGGPGLVKSGGGFAGGGFGLSGAVEGIAIAAVLNTLTARTTIKTVMRIQAAQCELFLLCTTQEPDALRIGLSRPLGVIRQARAGITGRTDETTPASVIDQLAKLAALLENGLLTREEFDRLKAALIAKT